jgi:hypothetical protein
MFGRILARPIPLPPLARRGGLAARAVGTSIDAQGRISKAGEPDVRRALYEAASALMTRFRGKDKLRTWGTMLAKSGNHRKAAVARKLAVIMHAMWMDGTFYAGDPCRLEPLPNPFGPKVLLMSLE